VRFIKRAQELGFSLAEIPRSFIANRSDPDIVAQKCTIAVLAGTGVLAMTPGTPGTSAAPGGLLCLHLAQTKADEGANLADGAGTTGVDGDVQSHRV
jgi:DNA-binding transcriptional MerR regulator